MFHLEVLLELCLRLTFFLAAIHWALYLSSLLTFRNRTWVLLRPLSLQYQLLKRCKLLFWILMQEFFEILQKPGFALKKFYFKPTNISLVELIFSLSTRLLIIQRWIRGKSYIRLSSLSIILGRPSLRRRLSFLSLLIILSLWYSPLKVRMVSINGLIEILKQNSLLCIFFNLDVDLYVVLIRFFHHDSNILWSDISFFSVLFSS